MSNFRGIRQWFAIAIIIVFLLHLGTGGYQVARWFRRYVLANYLINYNVPPDERLYTMSPNEYQAILEIWRTVPPDHHILWVPPISAMITYYIYPRRVYKDKIYKYAEKAQIDKNFIESRNIGFVFVDYGQLYRLQWDEGIRGETQ